jgi:hypothetical protein
MLNVRLTPKADADGENGGVAGVVLLTPAFFARFPNVRFFIAGPDDGGRKATYKYVNGVMEKEEETPARQQ